MAPLPSHALSVHNANKPPTNLNIHIDAHRIPGYTYLSSNVPESSTIHPRALAHSPQTIFPSLNSETHQKSALLSYQPRGNVVLSNIEVPVTLGPWDYLTGAFLVVLVIGLVMWMARFGEKPSSLAPSRPSRPHRENAKFVIKATNNAQHSYDSIVTITPAEDVFPAELNTCECAVETCELATDRARLLSKGAGGSDDVNLLAAARRCKCEVCRQDLETSRSSVDAREISTVQPRKLKCRHLSGIRTDILPCLK